MNTFFHISPTILGVGSVILPGNFGRIVKLYNPSSVNFDILTRETIFEQVRQQEFQDKPSRLDCLFLLESLEQAIEYKNKHAVWNVIYEVSVDTTGKSIHKGSYTFNIPQPINFPITMVPPPNTLQLNGYYNGLPELARTYWTTVPVSDIEIIINAPATIIRHHDTA